MRIALALMLAPLAAGAEDIVSLPEPIQAGPVKLTPYGFFEAITNAHTRTTGDGISTRFGAFPLDSNEPEASFSVRHSRLTLRGDMPAGPLMVEGYLETDFLNRPPREPYRIRQCFGQVTWGEWQFSAGQQWSLLRPNRHGMRSEGSLLNTYVVDPAYHVGVAGYRNRQVRVMRHMGDWHAGISFENGSDLLVKLASDSRALHWEVAGMAGTRAHHGVSAAAVIHLAPHADIVTQQFIARGGGQEVLGTVPAGVRLFSTLEGLEITVAGGFQVHGYVGVVRGSRSQGNRQVLQWSGGFWRTVSRNRLGEGTVGFQIARLNRALWDGPSGGMTFTMVSFRHYFGALR